MSAILKDFPERKVRLPFSETLEICIQYKTSLYFVLEKLFNQQIETEIEEENITFHTVL
jgi:hypothetical protein